MKTVGIKCPFCGGAVEFGEGEKTATEQKKNAEDRPKKNVSRVIFFKRFRFCAHARYFASTILPLKTRQA